MRFFSLLPTEFERIRLTRLFMGSMLLTELAVLLNFQPIRIIAPILAATIVPVLALATFQCNTYPHPVTPPALVSYL